MTRLDLNTCVANLTSGSGFKNPISTVVSGMTSTLSGITGTGSGVAALVSSLTTSLGTHSSALVSFIGTMPTKLPFLNAAENINKKLKISNGILPAVGGSTSFNNGVAPISVLQTQMSSFQAVLNANVAGLNSGDSGISDAAVAAVTAAASSMDTAISTSYTTSTTGFNDCVSRVRSFGFAKFISMPQQSHVQSIINDIVTIPDLETVQLDEKIGSSILQQGYLTTPVNGLNLKPLSPVEGYTIFNQSVLGSDTAIPGIPGARTFKQLKSDFLDAQSTIIGNKNTALTSANSLITTANTWQQSNIPDYNDIRVRYLNDPGNAGYLSAYNTAKNSYKINGYTAAAVGSKSFYDSKAIVDRAMTHFDTGVITGFTGWGSSPPWNA